MTDRELRKLSRVELLRLLLEESRENECLQEQLNQANQALVGKNIALTKAGSIAEAALALNSVSNAAVQAPQQHLDNIQRIRWAQQTLCQRMEDEARQKAEETLTETRRRCSRMEAEAQAKCEEMTASALQQSSVYWEDVRRQVEAFCAQRDALRELISPAGKDKASWSPGKWANWKSRKARATARWSPARTTASTAIACWCGGVGWKTARRRKACGSRRTPCRFPGDRRAAAGRSAAAGFPGHPIHSQTPRLIYKTNTRRGPPAASSQREFFYQNLKIQILT